MLSHLFKQEMGDKPYLQIEVDEHFSNVGVITRIEAFLNSLNHRPVEVLPKDFVLEQVDIRPVISRRCRKRIFRSGCRRWANTRHH